MNLEDLTIGIEVLDKMGKKVDLVSTDDVNLHGYQQVIQFFSSQFLVNQIYYVKLKTSSF